MLHPPTTNLVTNVNFSLNCKTFKTHTLLTHEIRIDIEEEVLKDHRYASGNVTAKFQVRSSIIEKKSFAWHLNFSDVIFRKL